MHSPAFPFRTVARTAAAITLFVVSKHAWADWPTFQHDPQRSGYASDERTLSPKNAGHLHLKWKRHFDDQALALNSLTPPVTASRVATNTGDRDVVYVAGASNHLFAADMRTGDVVWQRTFPVYGAAKIEPFFLCPNAINATPTIDRADNLIYALSSDGKLYGLDLGSGDIKSGPFQLVPPYAKAWSLNFANHTVYTTTSPGCGGERSAVYSVDLTDRKRPVIRQRLLAGGHGGGAWSRGGATIGLNGQIYFSTGDGSFDPEAGNYGNSFLALSAPALDVADRFTPANWEDLKKLDLDLPSGGSAAFTRNGAQFLAGGGKEAVVYLMNTATLGGRDHFHPAFATGPLGNDSKQLEQKGFWGAPAVWTDPQNQAWIYMPLWGAVAANATFPGENGQAPHGSILAFKVVDHAGSPVLESVWKSGDLNLPDVPVVANGVVFALATGENAQQTHDMHKMSFSSEKEWKDNLLTTGQRNEGTHPATLYALDAATGKELYRSAGEIESWVHFSGLAVDNGEVFVVDHSGTLYCFGIPESKPSGQAQ